MKIAATLALSIFLHTGKPSWLTDFAKAQSEAKGSHKTILLNFAGSDWCLPCIKMHKTIFETAAFASCAEKELVLVEADFPRLKKNRLSKEQQKQNDELAERYNPSGKFPYTLLIDGNGKVLKSWDGYPAGGPESFVTDVNAVVHGGK